MSILRKIVFYLFLTAYAVTCPLTVLYALGLIYKPGSEQGFVKTGLIYLTTFPQGATVYFDKSRYAQKTPVMIRDLMPGEYPVRISLPGYKTWQQTIPVKEERASALDYILLMPDQWTPLSFEGGTFEALQEIAGGDYLLMNTRDHLAGGMRIFHTGTHKMIIPELAENLKRAAVEKVYTIPESPLFILMLQSGDDRIYLKGEVSENECVLQDITRFFRQQPDVLSWSPHHEKAVFALYGSSLERIDFSDRADGSVIAENIRGFGLANHHFYGVRKDGSVIRTNERGEDLKILLPGDETGPQIFKEHAFYEIMAYPSDLMVLLGSEGDLITNRLPYKMVRKGVNGFLWDRKSERLLLWRDRSVGVIDFSVPKPVTDDSFEPGPKFSWVLEDCRGIQRAFWLYEGSHIIYQEGTEVYLLDLETYGKPSRNLIARVRKDSLVYFSEKDGFLYYLDENNGKLSAIEILPMTQILNISFPQKMAPVWSKDKKNEL